MLCAMKRSEQAAVSILTGEFVYSPVWAIAVLELKRVTSAGRLAHTCLVTRQQVLHNINRCSNSFMSNADLVLCCSL